MEETKERAKVRLGDRHGDLEVVRVFGDDVVNGNKYVVARCSCGTDMIVLVDEWGQYDCCYNCQFKKDYAVNKRRFCKTCGKPIPSGYNGQYCSMTCRVSDPKKIVEQDGCVFYPIMNTNEHLFHKSNYQGEQVYTKDVLWEEQYGKIPEGYKVVLTCGNPSCVNPKHLGLVPDDLIDEDVFYTAEDQVEHREEDLTDETLLSHFVTKEGRFRLSSAMNYYGLTKEQMFSAKKKLGMEKYLATLKHSSIAEAELFEWIPIENKIPNDRKILGGKELDIVLPDYHLAIEYNGLYWHSEANGRFANYHVDKLNATEAKGYQLFNIVEIIDDLDIWKSMILARLGMAQRIPARKCELRTLAYRDVRDFLAENHLQGSAVSSVQYGLFYDGELVEVMTFAKPRFARQYNFELVRLCTKKGLVVVGGASRLWTAFRREHPTASVISYANRRFSQGKVYRTLGFSLVKTTAPNYVYVRQDEVVTRYQAQKHRLPQLLGEGYDPNLSEFENMSKAGFERMYDCGNMVFEFRPTIDPP